MGWVSLWLLSTSRRPLSFSLCMLHLQWFFPHSVGCSSSVQNSKQPVRWNGLDICIWDLTFRFIDTHSSFLHTERRAVTNKAKQCQGAVKYQFLGAAELASAWICRHRWIMSTGTEEPVRFHSRTGGISLLLACPHEITITWDTLLKLLTYGKFLLLFEGTAHTQAPTCL
jgi:hypothetical protein